MSSSNYWKDKDVCVRKQRSKAAKKFLDSLPEDISKTVSVLREILLSEDAADMQKIANTLPDERPSDKATKAVFQGKDAEAAVENMVEDMEEDERKRFHEIRKSLLKYLKLLAKVK